MSKVNPSRIADVSSQLQVLSDTLFFHHMQIEKSLERLQQLTSELNGYNGAPASEEIPKPEFVNGDLIKTNILQSFWKVSISNLNAPSDGLSMLDHSGIDEAVFTCSFDGRKLYYASSVIAGYIQTISSTLNIDYNGSIYDFQKKLNHSSLYLEAKKNKTSLLPDNFDQLVHLNMFNQTREYGYKRLNSNTKTIEDSGCGISCFAAISYMLAKKNPDYFKLLSEAYEKKLYNGAGSSYEYIYDPVNATSKEYFEKKYGVTCSKIENNSYENLKKEVKNGNSVVVCVQQGKPNIEKGGFNKSSGGHFISLVDYDEKTDRFYVYNPNENNTGWTSRENIEKYVINVAQITTIFSKIN